MTNQEPLKDSDPIFQPPMDGVLVIMSQNEEADIVADVKWPSGITHRFEGISRQEVRRAIHNRYPALYSYLG